MCKNYTYIGLSLSASTGVLLGSPDSPILIQNLKRESVLHAEVTANSPQKLALNLLEVLFTHEELSTGNCTKPMRADIKILDSTKLQGIRGMWSI